MFHGILHEQLNTGIINDYLLMILGTQDNVNAWLSQYNYHLKAIPKDILLEGDYDDQTRFIEYIQRYADNI